MQTTKLYSIIFGQHDPGKTPKGKTSKDEIYYGDFKEKLQQRLQTNSSQVSSLFFLGNRAI
jgi:hypothetical protein